MGSNLGSALKAMILSVLFCAVAETAWCTVDSGPPPQSPQEGAGGDARSVQCPTSLSVVPGGDSVNSLPLFLVTLSTACPCSSLHCQQSALVSCYTVNSLPLFLVTLFLVTLSTVCHCSSLHCQQFGLVLRYSGQKRSPYRGYGLKFVWCQKGLMCM